MVHTGLMDDDVRLDAVQLALAQAKRVQRESRILVQSLARLRDDFEDQTPTGEKPQGAKNGNSTEDSNN